MTQVSGSIKCELIEGDCRYIRHLSPWSFFSDVLGDWCDAPAGFVNDTESVPVIRGTNREAGAGHDLVCRSDFKTREKGIVPTKWQAARAFLELQKFYDEKEAGNVINRGWDWIRRYFKTGIVVAAWGYWQKYKVLATYEEMSS